MDEPINRHLEKALEKTKEKLQRPKESVFKRIAKILTHRLSIGLVLMGLQLTFYVLSILVFQRYFVHAYVLCSVLSILVTLGIASKRSHPDYRAGWLVVIIAFPVFGTLFYLFFGGSQISDRQRRRLARLDELTSKALGRSEALVDELATRDSAAGNQSRYLIRASGYPPHLHTRTEYLPQGEIFFRRLLEELEKAERYIYLEFFILKEGVMWDSILNLLEEKARAGVDVRVLYDDIGSLFTLPKHYAKTLQERGIACAPFNPFVPVVNLRLNNRDHRKICVIDGKVGFTGGMNLSDEYINQWERFGHWKDTGILLEGSAVWNLVVMFLTMWDYTTGVEENYEDFRPSQTWLEEIPTDGIVQPYDASPLAQESVGAGVYMNLINHAQRYLYVTTPYLILDDAMVNAFCRAARSGVDVRIITPHIPDKRYVFELTRANYNPLLEAGVRIFEYTPGFIHAKTFAVDDAYGVVGTINLDYRSLYLHFEDGVWLYHNSAVLDVRNDFLKTQAMSEEVFLEETTRIDAIKQLFRAVLRLLAPLL